MGRIFGDLYHIIHIALTLSNIIWQIFSFHGLIVTYHNYNVNIEIEKTAISTKYCYAFVL